MRRYASVWYRAAVNEVGTETCAVSVLPKTSSAVNMNVLRIGATLMFLVAHLAGCSDANAPTEVSAVAAVHFTGHAVLEPVDSVAREGMSRFVVNTVVLESVHDDTGAALVAPELPGTADAGVDHDGVVVPIPKYLADRVIPILEGVAEGVIPIPQVAE